MKVALPDIAITIVTVLLVLSSPTGLYVLRLWPLCSPTRLNSKGWRRRNRIRGSWLPPCFKVMHRTRFMDAPRLLRDFWNNAGTTLSEIVVSVRCFGADFAFVASGEAKDRLENDTNATPKIAPLCWNSHNIGEEGFCFAFYLRSHIKASKATCSGQHVVDKKLDTGGRFPRECGCRARRMAWHWGSKPDEPRFRQVIWSTMYVVARENKDMPRRRGLPPTAVVYTFRFGCK